MHPFVRCFEFSGLTYQGSTIFVSYVKNHAFPQPLPPEEEKKYIKQMQEGDGEARNKLIEHNLRLVAHIVKNSKTPEKIWKILFPLEPLV